MKRGNKCPFIGQREANKPSGVTIEENHVIVNDQATIDICLNCTQENCLLKERKPNKPHPEVKEVYVQCLKCREGETLTMKNGNIQSSGRFRMILGRANGRFTKSKLVHICGEVAIFQQKGGK